MAKNRAHDMSLSLEERAAAALEQDLNGQPEAEERDAAPLPPGMGESNSKANLKARMDAMKMLNIDESGERKGALPPNVQKIYQGADYMNIILDGRQDGVRDNSPEKRDFKVVRNIIPEDIYDSRPDHRMFGWFLYFMHPAFGTEVLPGSKTGLTPGGVYIQRLVELATGHGAKPLTYLRETVWALIRDGKILKGGDLSLLPRDRVLEDDDDNHPDNIGLQALLEFSTYHALQNESRRHNTKPKNILTFGIKFAVDAGVLTP